MKLPDGWVFIPKMKRRSTIEVEQKELVTCKNCIFQNTDNCKWREDESPDPDDYCSVGEAE